MILKSNIKYSKDKELFKRLEETITLGSIDTAYRTYPFNTDLSINNHKIAFIFGNEPTISKSIYEFFGKLGNPNYIRDTLTIDAPHQDTQQALSSILKLDEYNKFKLDLNDKLKASGLVKLFDTFLTDILIFIDSVITEAFAHALFVEMIGYGCNEYSDTQPFDTLVAQSEVYKKLKL